MQKDERRVRHRKGQQNISSFSFHAYVGQACIGAVDSGVQKSATMLGDRLAQLPRDVRRAKPEKEDGHMLGLFLVFRFVHMISTTDPVYGRQQ